MTPEFRANVGHLGMTLERRESWSASLIAWGHPSDPRTFSGYSHRLAEAMRDRNVLRGEFTARQIRCTDLFRGALGLRLGTVRPSIRRSWMWSRRGSEMLSRRLNDEIRSSGDRGAFLQIGTLIDLDPSAGRHYLLTDMTIAQAYREGQFEVGRLSSRQVTEAMEVQRQVASRARHIFTLSEWARESVIEDLAVEGSRVTTVYAGSNLRLPATSAIERREAEVLFVGTNWERKGGPALVEAFAKVRGLFPNATLRIVGCSPRVAMPGVHVEGFLSTAHPTQRQRLIDLYLQATCFCLPSVFDPFPNAIIEAAAAGLAVVAVDNGSRREAVVPDTTGVLVADGTPASIAQGLCQLLGEPERCRRMGEYAKRRAMAEFSWERVLARIGDVISADQGRTVTSRGDHSNGTSLEVTPP